jgi:hypothetical protein
LCTLLSTTVGQKVLSTTDSQNKLRWSVALHSKHTFARVCFDSAKEGFAPETADADKASSAAQRLLVFIVIFSVRP